MSATSSRPAAPSGRTVQRTQHESACARRDGSPLRAAGFFLAVLVTASVPGWSRAANAATNAGLQAEAGRISSSISSDEATLQTEGLNYLALEGRYSAESASVAATRTRIATLERRAAAERIDVRSAAVAAYVGAGSSDTVGLLLAGTPDTAGIKTAYLRVATDDLDSSITLLGGDEVMLRSTLVTEEEEQTAMARSLADTAAARSSALATLASERTLLNSVNGSLSALVAAQTAARERAAEAAAAAASATPPASGPPAPTGVLASKPAPATATAPPAPTPDPIATSSLSSLASDFAAIRNCESGGDYALNTGNGYYGAYQFSASTWSDLGEPGLANKAPPSMQDAAAYRLYRSSGWSSWPTCAAVAGLS